MWVGSRVLRAAIASASVFRPHFHQHPCAICQAATEEFRDASHVSSRNDSVIAPTLIDSSSSNSGGFASSSSPHVVAPLVAGNGVSMWLTIRERRAEALLQWMQMDENCHVNPQVEEDAHLQKCWEAFCDTGRTLSEKEIAGAIDFLDTLCQVKVDDVSANESDLEQTREPKLTSLVDENAGTLISDDAFLARIRASFSDPVATERQLRFKRTLVDFRHLANSLSLPFFLCCGTALAAHREGFFIPHDDDIDVGIFYEDLERMCIAAEGDTQSAVVALLSHVARDGRFITFDICGTVEKGLELRFLHSETRVALDLNVYYPPLAEDAALVAQCGPFVWTATHYEDAAARLHGMYRYRHAPFASSLLRISFCDPEVMSSSDGFLVPPESYLLEYFGEHWRTPRQFSYAEGLRRGEYKNIIVE